MTISTTAAAILAVLNSYPVSRLDTMQETGQERAQRLQTVALAIEQAGNRAACFEQVEPCRPIIGDRWTAYAVLAVQARRESGLRRDVQLGECRAHECDRGRAKGPWQLHKRPSSDTEQDWRGFATLDLDGLQRGAWRTISLWASGWHAGHKHLHCGFGRLAGYGICWSDYGRDRAAETMMVAAQLRRITK